MTGPAAPASKLDQQDIETVTLSSESMAQLSLMITTAVDDGLRAKLNAETAKVFWQAGIDMLKEDASKKAKAAAKWGAKQIAKKVVLFLGFGWIMYLYGGWEGLTKFAKWVFFGTH